MTGPVTWELLIWVGGTILAALILEWRIVSWVLNELSTRDLSIAAVDARAKLAEEELRRSFETHKLYGYRKLRDRGGLTQAVNRVDDAVKRLTDRMDRYFEPTKAKARARTRSTSG